MRKLLALAFGFGKTQLSDIQKRRKAVLDDTIKYFNTNTRSIDVTLKCCYRPTELSEGCAVGRLIKDKELCKQLDLNLEGVGTGVCRVFNKLPIEVQELGEGFLSELQTLHDLGGYWDENGLCESGVERANRIREQYIENKLK